MARGDITIVNGAAASNVFSWATDDRTTSTINATIKAGEPVEAGGTGNNFAILLINGEPNQTDTTRMIGIASADSNETSSADGEVDVHHIVPMATVLRCRAATPANVNTLAEWRALQGDTVTFDGITAITGDTDTTPYTIDENEGDDPNDHGLVMVGWDKSANTPAFIQFVVKPLVTLFGNNL